MNVFPNFTVQKKQEAQRLSIKNFWSERAIVSGPFESSYVPEYWHGAS
jgi:hypothetical protein